MKVRKLAVALALAGGLGSGMAQALGLGEIELQSWLNEPLDAEISLRQSAGVDPGDVFVNVAPEAAYQRVGLERNQFLSKLKFEVVTGSDGNLAINVSSREPVREPYLNFLLELTWPNGRLMREYAVLVDPPVYAEESGVREQVSAPVSSAASAPARQTTTRSPESIRREAAVQRAPARGYQPDTFGPTGPSDTLWMIAQRMRPDSSVSMQQMMLAIQDLNPDAFIDGNINKLKRGQVLRAPTLDQIQRRTKAEANRVVARQNEEFQSPRPVDATRTAQAETAPAQTAENAGTDELKLLVAEEETSPRTDDEGGSAGGDGEQAGGADAGNAVAMEELDATRRENEELSSRLQDMQEQVQTLQRLLELKNSQLAELQGMTQEEAAAALAAEGDSAQAGAAGTDANADGETAAATESADSEEPAAQAGESAEAREGESADTEADMAEGSADTTAAVAGAGEQAEASAAEGESESAEAPAEAEGDASGSGQSDVTGADTAAQPGADTEFAEATEAAEADDAPAAAAAPAQEESRAQPKPPQTAPAKEKGFFGQFMDTVLGNPMYQIALGGGLILLLLLLLLVARKNAKREKDFYDEFNRGEDDSADDSVDLGTAGVVAGAAQEETADVLAEAETYIAYGRNDQAIEVLETAISREPSRADLRLKLLSVYADNQDRDAFEKQYGEVAALEDESALQEAEAIRGRLDEAESMPSIDDLESQLRSDSFSLTDNEPEQALSFETPEQEPEEDWSLSDELKADEFEAAADEVKENEFGELESDSSLETAADDNSVEFDLSDFELDAEDAGLDQLDSEQPAEEEIDLGLEGESLDESFLDELDAELEKVSSEEDSLEELELDVSDEDLALMEEFSEDSESPEVDEELGLEDALQELETEEDPLGDVPVVEPEPEAEAVTPATGLDIDESDLEDDDFDFLAGTDEAATKLDLARAYIEMGDSDGARDILEEVALEGNDDQKAEAQELLKNLS